MGKDITDKELEQILSERIKEDPQSFLHFLRTIIDRETPSIAIDDEQLFNLIKPTFQHRKALTNQELEEFDLDSSAHNNISEEDFDLIPSSIGIDQLFFPWVRTKLKEWQRNSLDPHLEVWEREKHGKEKLQEVFKTLVYADRTQRDRGRPKCLSREDEKKIIEDYPKVKSICKTLSTKRRWKNTTSRNDLIRSAFPDVADAILNEENPITTPKQLCCFILSKRCGCTPRNIDDFFRNIYDIFKFFEKYPDAVSVEDGPLNNQSNKRRVIVTHKNGKKTIISK